MDLLNDSNGKIDLKKLSDTLDDSPTESQIAEGDAEKMVSSPILNQLKALLKILRILFNTFRQNIHVKFSKIHVRVGTNDAAKTAILYGAISTAVVGIVELLDAITNLDKIKDSSISVEPDFLSDKTDVKIDIMLHITVFGLIKVLMKSFLKYFSLNDISKINTRKETKNG